MHEPIKNCIYKKHPEGSVTQWFGENPALYSRFGLAYHNGIDIVAPHGTPLLAVEDGIIADVKLDAGGFGKHVRLRSLHPTEKGVYRYWVYGHCSHIRVVPGEKVRAGEHIADMGNTGFTVSGSTPFWQYNPYAGTHLHLGLRLATPDEAGWRYRGDDMRIRILNYDNGVKGAVDPMKYLVPVAKDELTPEQRKHFMNQLLTIQSMLNTLKALWARKQRTTKI